MFNVKTEYLMIDTLNSWNQKGAISNFNVSPQLDKEIQKISKKILDQIQSLDQLKSWAQKMTGQKEKTVVYCLKAQEEDQKNQASIPELVKQASVLECLIVRKISSIIQKENLLIEPKESIKITLLLGMIPIHELVLGLKPQIQA